MPIEVTDIERLAKLLAKTSVASIEIEQKGQSLKLVTDMSEPTTSLPALAAPTSPSADAPVIAKADVAGHFLASHPWRAKPFVEHGQRIEAGAIVGLVKVGLLYAPVLSPVTGILVAVIAKTGALVGYGTPIASIRPVAGTCS
jgi:acetyl-CoA carboxylase biotin carboxyl carrier protein